MSNETISVGSCKTCGAPVQFLEDGTTRHVDIKQDEIDRLRAELEQRQSEVLDVEAREEELAVKLSVAEARVRELEEKLSVNTCCGHLLWSGVCCGNIKSLNDIADEALANSEKE